MDIIPSISCLFAMTTIGIVEDIIPSISCLFAMTTIGIVEDIIPSISCLFAMTTIGIVDGHHTFNILFVCYDDHRNRRWTSYLQYLVCLI